MRKLFYISTFLLISGICFSQMDEIDFGAVDMPDSTVFLKKGNTIPKRQLDFNMSVGMSYMFSSNGFNGTAMSFTPSVSYPLSGRLNLTGGLHLEHGNFMMPNYRSDISSTEMLPMTRMFLYTGGNYLVNEKLSVTGSVYQQILDVPNRNNTSSTNQTKSTFNSSGISMGFNYKLAPNISFGAQIRVESSNSPWTNPYYHQSGGYYNPYYW